ncbi:pseudouridine synthase, partial [Mesorhizobium sp. M3A.F.Ca.ET.174.01.1.1]|uniref:pseudouridine synthase n=1 Tax=Mesorhizobium sp. M3A.F.Ca.ET.174.01.1.1 TaxID=2563944 RepID=UPI001FE0C105
EGDRSGIRFSVAHLRQLAPAGRLDIDSTGLLVLTQDGRIAKQLIGGHSEIDKEYLVRVAYGEHTVDVESHFPPESLALLRHGIAPDRQRYGQHPPLQHIAPLPFGSIINPPSLASGDGRIPSHRSWPAVEAC